MSSNNNIKMVLFVLFSLFAGLTLGYVLFHNDTVVASEVEYVYVQGETEHVVEYVSVPEYVYDFSVAAPQEVVNVVRMGWGDDVAQDHDWLRNTCEVAPVCACNAVTETVSITVTPEIETIIPTVTPTPNTDNNTDDDDTTIEIPEVVPTPQPETTPEPKEEPKTCPEGSHMLGNGHCSGNNGLGNGEDPAPKGIQTQINNGKKTGQNDDPAVPGNPQYKGNGGNSKKNKS